MRPLFFDEKAGNVSPLPEMREDEPGEGQSLLRREVLDDSAPASRSSEKGPASGMTRVSGSPIYPPPPSGPRLPVLPPSGWGFYPTFRFCQEG